jgi:hypothetical protein
MSCSVGDLYALALTMTLANIHPRTEQKLTWGQEVTMAWSPVCGVVLTD